jgi:hypothetical protein
MFNFDDPKSIILALETGPVSFKWWGGKHLLCWVHYKDFTPASPLKMDPVSKISCYLEYWMMDKVQKSINPNYHTPVSEPF